MKKKPKRIIFMALGLLDYLRDRWEDLQDELERRGEDRAEDINDFWDDILENVSSTVGEEKTPDECEDGESDGEERSGMAGLLADMDVKGIVADMMDDVGLARHEDLDEIDGQLDRIGRAIENL